MPSLCFHYLLIYFELEKVFYYILIVDKMIKWHKYFFFSNQNQIHSTYMAKRGHSRVHSDCNWDFPECSWEVKNGVFFFYLLLVLPSRKQTIKIKMKITVSVLDFVHCAIKGWLFFVPMTYDVALSNSF